MIIKSPTANYSTILPDISESGNITYTISNNLPPRKNSIATLIPPGAVLSRPTKPKTPSGKLIMTTTGGYFSATQSSTKQYNVGDVLEFENLSVIDDKKQEFQALDTRYDLDVIDYRSIGLSDAEIALINNVGFNENEKIREDLNSTNVKYNDTKTQISSIQSTINSIDKTIKALELISDKSAIEGVLAKILNNKQDLLSQLDSLNASLNDLYSKMLELTDKARNIGVIIK